MSLRGLVECRAYDLALYRPLHVGHLFGALVYEEHEEDYLWMVRGYRICEFLKEDGLAGPRRGDYEAPLPLADGREEVHYPHRDVCRLVLLLALELEVYLLLRIERGEVVEEYLVSGYLGVLVVDLLDFQEREVPLALLRGPYLAGDNVSRAQVEPPYLRGGYVYVVRARKVVVVRRAEKPEAVREGLEHAFAVYHPVLFALGLQEGEDQVLLAHARGLLYIILLGERCKLVDLFLLKFLKVHTILL